ncbi:MAG: DUF1841 family protein [Gammaproteobacteria bacterium]|nr:DUF1841 family protein [Gammaproteobacteria bacterium]MDE2251052.1 DUF1841 family protein [Gammaproteobacteria bacterium]
MYAGQDRAQLRAAWREAWRRRLQGLPLEPLQALMSDLVGMHPEYAPQLEQAAPAAHADGDSFLHLALHLALREQLATNRPAGIAQVHQRLAAAGGDGHEAEHRMIEVLGRVLWDAQRAGRMPDEQQYLEALRRL